MKSVDVVELRIRRNKKSIAGRLIKFLINYDANRVVNFSGHNATKLALNTMHLIVLIPGKVDLNT